MHIVWKRDLTAYFHTAVGYVFMGVFLTLSGLIFYLYNIKNLTSDLLSFLSQLTLPTMLLCPLLTMRLLCEDRQKRTDQLVLTSPVSLTGVVMGKYLAAACVMLLTLLLTNVYTLIIVLCGQVYLGEWFVGYLGFALQSLAFLALDLFVSCFAKNQMTGAVMAFGANFVLWMADLLAGSLSVGWMQNALNFISLYDRYEPFRLGQFSFSGTLFFVSFIAVCLVGAVRVLDAHRFSEGGAA
ncbi:MAG: ABC transporter permease subunit [Candidatus Limiplasma sp.]|nr:ABC transporter permease subunit [Candidatus Limiplasma sp.]